MTTGFSGWLAHIRVGDKKYLVVIEGGKPLSDRHLLRFLNMYYSQEDSLKDFEANLYYLYKHILGIRRSFVVSPEGTMGSAQRFHRVGGVRWKVLVGRYWVMFYMPFGVREGSNGEYSFFFSYPFSISQIPVCFSISLFPSRVGPFVLPCMFSCHLLFPFATLFPNKLSFVSLALLLLLLLLFLLLNLHPVITQFVSES